MLMARTGQAQLVQQAVGGVVISVEGQIDNAEPWAQQKLREVLREAMNPAPGPINQPAKLRMISLRGLQEAIAAGLKANPNPEKLPDEVRYLGGLQRVQYLFLDAEHHDIILAGPADGWVVDNLGDVVGRTNGQPVIQLDDLLVAFRYADAARRGGIQCSINPTDEGMQKLRNFLGANKRDANQLKQTLTEMEDILGTQKIRLNGVPDSSRFAWVMVAADFRMKRLGMGFEPAPIKGLPSYLDMIPPGAKVQNMQPRWWLATNYQALSRSDDGTAWAIHGQGVKCLTEEDFITSTGSAKAQNKSSPAAQKWADLMTAKYDELSDHDTVFRQLRNCFDLALIGALVEKEHLEDRADCRLDLIKDAKRLPLYVHQIPREVASKASFVKKGHNYVISVSGGIQLQPWQLIQDVKTDSAPSAARGKALQASSTARSWWWDGGGA
jgi:hypothetical protein